MRTHNALKNIYQNYKNFMEAGIYNITINVNKINLCIK